MLPRSLGLVLCLDVALLGTQLVNAAGQPAISLRPAEVVLKMTGSPKRYDGVCKDARISRICGETDPMYTGSHSYVFEYPDVDDPATITTILDVVFSAEDLIGGKPKATSKFFVSASVTTADGRRPAAYVVDTRTNSKVSGQATLLATGKTEPFQVTATNELGETLSLTVECKPK